MTVLEPLSPAQRREQLIRDRQRFVHATVVRVEQPTSARAGDQAIVYADGRLEGFVGGQCTVSSVKVAAVGALRDRKSVLLRVLPEGAPSFPETDGAAVVVNPCLSGGSVEIFLEPVLPAPVLHVAGESPIARAVAEVGALMGYAVTLADEGATVADATIVVIARHGGPEASEIRAALAAGARYVGLVASVRRGAAVLEEAGLTDAERARVFSPAGHSVGAATPGEIAVSILAQAVQVLHERSADDDEHDHAGHDHAEQVPGEVYSIGRGPAPEPQLAVDPVCGMSVVVAPDAVHLAVDGEDFYFCRTGCRDAFAEQRGVTVDG